MTIYCYDTEFLDDGNTIDLISIGIVCEDGREYYAVNSDFDQDRLKLDKWMVENVVAHLPLAGSGVSQHSNASSGWYWTIDNTSPLVKPKWVIRNEVREFILARPVGLGEGEWQPSPRLWAYYAAYDHVALAQLFGKMINLPKGFPMWTHDLMQALEGVKVTLPPQPADAHNALADARWNWELLQRIQVASRP